MSSLLKEKFWNVIEDVQLSDIRSIASELGDIIPYKGKEVYELIPKNVHSSLSLSGKFGFGKFPLHTDGISFNLGVKYILLFSESKSITKTNITTVQDIFHSEEDFNLFKRLTCNLNILGRKKLLSPVSGNWNNPIIRFDSRFCQSAGESFNKLYLKFLDRIEKAKVVDVEYKSGTLLILDNEKCLHGRDKVIEKNRKLYRLYVR